MLVAFVQAIDSELIELRSKHSLDAAYAALQVCLGPSAVAKGRFFAGCLGLLFVSFLGVC